MIQKNKQMNKNEQIKHCKKNTWNILQGQNYELIHQNEESSTKVRHSEDSIENGKQKIAELEKLLSNSR